MLKRFLLIFFFAFPIFAVEYPQFDTLYVNDFADVLNEKQEAEMRDALAGLKEKTGVELTIVTIHKMADYGYMDYDYHAFATGLFNHWGVGNAEANNGVMILLSKGDRFVRIEVGAGYGKDMDRRAQRVYDRDMLPRLRDNQFDLGLIEGVKSMLSEIRVMHGLEAARPWWERIRFNPALLVFAGIFTAIAARMIASFEAGRAFLNGLRGKLSSLRLRRCNNCSQPMTLISDFDKHENLTQAQLQEEALGGREWQVYECKSCGEIESFGRKPWFSEIASCPQCQNFSLEGEEEVVEKASTFKQGKKKHSDRCSICGYQNVSYHSYRSGGRGGGGGFGGNFGGGSSSGGGGGGRF